MEYCASITLENLLITHDRLPVWNIANNLVIGVVKDKIIEQLQVVYNSYPGLNRIKTFKYQVEISMSSKFDRKQ